jgi:hypothetical protein
MSQNDTITLYQAIAEIAEALRERDGDFITRIYGEIVGAYRVSYCRDFNKIEVERGWYSVNERDSLVESLKVVNQERADAIQEMIEHCSKQQQLIEQMTLHVNDVIKLVNEIRKLLIS